MKEKICVVGYKTGLTGACSFGETFSELKECCNTFGRWFKLTGNNKTTDFDAPVNDDEDESDGFHFVTRGNELQVVLRVDSYEDQMHSCPFCGARIKVEETSVVELKEKFKKVFDGYSEKKVSGK